MTEEKAWSLGLLNHNSALQVLDLNCQFDEPCFWNAALFPMPATKKTLIMDPHVARAKER